MRYVSWTKELEEEARFLLDTFRDYDQVAEELEIPRSALKNRNNKYWNIDCRKKWTGYNDEVLKLYRKKMLKKEIAELFGTTENAVAIRLSHLKASNKL